MHHPPNIKKEEPPQVLPRSQASQVSATRSLYFILLNFMRLVKQFLQFSIVYADVIYLIPLFCNGNGVSVSIRHRNCTTAFILLFHLWIKIVMSIYLHILFNQFFYSSTLWDFKFSDRLLILDFLFSFFCFFLRSKDLCNLIQFSVL